MSDPQLEVDVDGRPMDPDAVVAGPEPEAWLVKRSEPRWQVWRDHNRRRPPSRAERRGRLAAATAGTLIGVLGVSGAISYVVQWQDTVSRALDALKPGNPYWMDVWSIAKDPAGRIQSIVEFQGQQPGATGWIGVVDGKVVASTESAAASSGDPGLVGAIDRAASSETSTTDSYSSRSSICVYEVTPVHGDAGERAALVRVVDLTGTRDGMKRGYLAYGLVALGVAGAAGGGVWWGLGRQLNRKIEPEEV